MKRSLALGALMAFVITGSAWAYTDVNGNLVPGADESKITGEQITTRITDYVTLAGQDGVVENKKITNITTSDYQGGVFKVTSKATFDNCIFSGNKLTSPASTAEGGVIYVGGSGNVTITSSTFENNTVQSAKGSHRSYGAAIASSGTLTIDGCKFGKHIAIGSNNPYGVVIRVGGGVASISNTEFIDSVGFGWSTGVTKNGKDAIYNCAVLNLENNKFEDISGNCINNISSGTVKITGTENKFIGYTGRAIYNYGELIFEEGSVTTFAPGYNGRDITNRNGGSITVKEGATVNLEGVGIDLDEGTSGEVNLLGTVNGNIGGNNIVKFSSSGVLNGSMVEGFNAKGDVSTGFCEVEFNGGTWNMTGDSVVKGIVVNGDATINGAKENGGKSSLTLDRKLTNIEERAINHTSGDLTIQNVVLENINKDNDDSTSGSQGSVIYSRGKGTSLTLLNSTVQNNTNDGEQIKRNAVIRVDGDMTVNKVDFLNNKALGKDGDATAMGGAFYISTATGYEKVSVATITNSTFTGNESAEGGAVFVNNAIVNFENSDFSKNHARVNGGALNVQYTGAVVSLNGEYDFTGNTAGKNGGAIAVYGNPSDGRYGILTIDGNKANFTGNEANGQGGAIHNEGIMNVNGIATFTDNIANGIANDIYNVGTVNINQGATVKLDGGIDGTGTTNINGGNLELGGNNRIGILKVSDGGKIAFGEKGHLDVDEIDESSDIVTITMVGKDADDLNTKEQLTTVAERMGVAENYKATDKVKVVMTAGEIVGETTGDVVFETKVNEDGIDYYHGVVKNKIEQSNPANEAISDTAIGMKLHWRAHVNDMNKRMGELRDANGEHGVWTRMVRGESEYKNTKAQYNQYQLGYDEKLSVDKRWTVGAAVTFSEGDASYGYGSTEDKSTAFAIYGSKLNNDGTFVDLIARYAHLESDVDDQAGTGSYSANGMSVSAEVGKRIQQGNGLWIEPQAELTYGTIDSAEYKLGTKTIEVGDMDSLIGRIGFRIGKDIEKGNVYARASYLYDFEGETENAFRNDTARRSFNEDLGGGWWEVGVGANINLSKATYVYADVEKTFGGEVDTNWQWNLGVRYSF